MVIFQVQFSYKEMKLKHFKFAAVGISNWLLSLPHTSLPPHLNHPPLLMRPGIRFFLNMKLGTT